MSAGPRFPTRAATFGRATKEGLADILGAEVRRNTRGTILLVIFLRPGDICFHSLERTFSRDARTAGSSLLSVNRSSHVSAILRVVVGRADD